MPSALTAAAAACVALVALGVARRDAPSPYAGPVALAAPEARTVEAAWGAVIHQLDVARAAGFGDPVSADPAEWADPACPCSAADRGRLAALAAAGHALDVTPATVTDVVAVVTHAGVALTWTDRLPAYDEVDAAGRVVRRWPGRGPTRWRGVLVRSGAGWRWGSVAAAEDHDPARGVDRSRVG
ncbi:MAG TPA: hypothetical protein VNA12_08670 [Mycobacteriales bacterium]|nr:hypothetical protein [Mycobacteriales bacterium]